MRPSDEQLRRFLRGDLPAEDIADVAVWLEADPDGASALARVYDRNSLAAALARPPGALENGDFPPGPREGRASETPEYPTGYEIFEELGRGGMGVVFRAHHAALDRDVAVKFLLPKYATDSSTARRFVEEARIAARLQHPGIPAVHEVGTLGDGRPYLAMKLIRGRTLAALLKEQGYGSAKWLGVFESICHAVGSAHQSGYIHRDLKPGNVMIGAFGEVQVMDWGLAKKLTAEPADRPQQEGGPEPSEIQASDETLPAGDESSVRDTEQTNRYFPVEEGDRTQYGHAKGTPRYMPPEQARGEIDRIDRRADVFALGAILCELLTGRPPLTGSGDQLVLESRTGVYAEALVRLDRSGEDRELISLAKRCLAVDPDTRPSDASAVAAAVAKHREESEIRAKKAEVETARAATRIAEQRIRQRVQLFLGGAVLAALLIGGALATWQWSEASAAQRTAEGKAEDERKEKERADEKTIIADQKTAEAQTNLTLAQKETARANSATGLAENEKTQALIQLNRAEKLVLASKLKQADQAIRAGQVPLAVELLNDCQWDLRGWEHSYLWSQISAKQSFKLATLTSDLAFTPDGKYLIGVPVRMAMKIWNVETGDEVPTGDQNKGEAQHLAFAIAGSEARLIGLDLEVRKWDPIKGALLETFPGMPAKKGTLNSFSRVAMHPNGKWLAYANDVHTQNNEEYPHPVKMWDIAEREPLSTFDPVLTHGVSDLQFNPDGSWMATSSRDKTLRLWNVRTRKQAFSLGGYDRFDKIRFTSDGLWVGCYCSKPFEKGTNESSVVFWDIKTQKEAASVRMPAGGIYDFAVSPDGERVATGSHDHKVRLYDVRTGQLLATYHGHASPVHIVRFSPDGTRIASSDYSGEIKVWDALQPPNHPPIAAHKGPVKALAFDPDSVRMASSSINREVKIWDSARDMQLAAISAHGFDVNGVAVSRDGRWIGTCGNDRGVKIWDAATGKLHKATRGHPSVAFAVAFSADSRYLVSAGGGRGEVDVDKGNGKVVKEWVDLTGDMYLWDVSTGELAATLKAHSATVYSFAFSDDGEHMATASQDQTVKVWDFKRRVVVQSLQLKGAGRAVAFSPDGKILATACGANIVKLWNWRTGETHYSFKEKTGEITCLAFSRDGARLFGGCQDGTVKVWDAASGQELLALAEHKSEVKSLALSRDGNRLASGAADGTIKVWEITKEQTTFYLRGHSQIITAIAFGDDGKRVFAKDKSGEVLAWFTKTGQPAPAQDAPEMAALGAGAVACPDGSMRAEPFGSPAFGNVAVKMFPTQKTALSANAWPLPDPAARRAYHSEQAASSERKEFWSAAHFHLKQLRALSPDDMSFKARLDEVVAKQKRAME